MSATSDLNIRPIIERSREDYHKLNDKLSSPAAFSNPQAYQQLNREHQRLSTLLSVFDELENKRRELVETQELLDDDELDDELRELAAADAERLENDIARLEPKVYSLVVPPDPNDSRNTIIEIRPAAGGDEAALFAGDLFRMYTRYAERQGWKSELLNISETDLGGLKDVGFSMQGEDVYRMLKLESGVHRVQRVPTTEASGRIHTSTVTVAVLPEAREVDVQINNDDLQIDVFRASGAGGQHVNTTDSAVRITHIPSGVVVASQQERSQHRNREIAMRILRTRLLEARQQEEQAKYEARRRAQVGTGDRSERIRTYNFPQNRVTDHRYGLSWFDLPQIMDGDLDAILEDLHAAASLQRLQAELEANS